VLLLLSLGKAVIRPSYIHQETTVGLQLMFIWHRSQQKITESSQRCRGRHRGRAHGRGLW